MDFDVCTCMVLKIRMPIIITPLTILWFYVKKIIKVFQKRLMLKKALKGLSCVTVTSVAVLCCSHYKSFIYGILFSKIK